MKYKIYILYRDREPHVCNASEESEIEDEVRYWMGKSPGMYKSDIEDIIAFPADQSKSFLYVIDKMDNEAAERDMRRQDEEERANYEILKKKFEK